jgi:phosphoserine aminotransferase
MTKTNHNFCAGPCVLPETVIQAAAEAVRSWHPSGLSLLEISHRDPAFVEVMEEARSLLLELLELPGEEYAALFLHGGASTQFLSVAANFLNKRAAYADTGTWSAKAIKEAQYYGRVEIVASSRDEDYTCIPDIPDLNPDTFDFLHLTSNNTIFGTQWSSFPKTRVPLIADMSSDLFARSIDARDFDLIYAGAQKNAGPAGVTLLVVRRAFLDTIQRELPSMLDYRMHVSKNSMFNTPPVFAVYTSLLNLRWLREQGGVNVMEKRNRKKAETLYEEIDRNPLVQGVVRPRDRSLMNATFRLTDPALKDGFDRLWKEAGIYGLNGHRSVGGYRASMYNALELDSVRVLTEVLNYFERKLG